MIVLDLLGTCNDKNIPANTCMKGYSRGVILDLFVDDRKHLLITLLADLQHIESAYPAYMMSSCIYNIVACHFWLIKLRIRHCSISFLLWINPWELWFRLWAAKYIPLSLMAPMRLRFTTTRCYHTRTYKQGGMKASPLNIITASTH